MLNSNKLVISILNSSGTSFYELARTRINREKTAYHYKIYYELYYIKHFSHNTLNDFKCYLKLYIYLN